MKFSWLRKQRDEDLDAEIRSHLDEAIRDRIARGETPDEARANALREFGNVGLVKEVTREMWGCATLERLMHDLRFGLRMLRKNPGFSLVAILTLALGLGMNVAVFSVVNAVLLKPLPYPEPERLVTIQNQFMARNLKNAGVSAADYVDYRGRGRIFEEVAAGSSISFNLTGVERAETIPGMMVTAGLFPLLGVKPVAGHVFSAEEDQPGRNQVAVLSAGFWRRRFGGDPQVVGRTLQLNDQSYTVVGVIPAALEFLGAAEIFTPAAFTAEQMNPARRSVRSLFALARLKRGVSLAQAQSEMNAFARSLAADFPNDYPAESGWGVRLDSVRELWVGEVRLALWVLWATVGLVLLIACANVANLLLARAIARSREISIRAALGASAGRLARQLLTETALLGLLGGVAGLLLAAWTIKLLARIAPENFPRLAEIGIDWQALGFTLGISLLTGLLAGLAPLLQVFRRNLHKGIKDGGRGAAGGLRSQRTRSLLVVTQVALSLILLLGAGLLLQSFARLLRADPGFRSENTLTFRVALPATRYPNQPQRVAFIDRMIEGIRPLPGVAAVGATSMLPFIGLNSSGVFGIEGRNAAGGPQPHADVRTVTPGFFAALGIPLRQGRLFAESDTAEAPFVALADEKLAAQYWPNENPIGKRVQRGGPQSPWYTIVGVVGHVRHSQLDAESKGALYFPYAQHRAFMITLVVRASHAPEQLAGVVQREVAALDKDVPVYEIRTMEDRLLASLTPQRMSAYLIAVFAGVALLLAALGIYGVMSYSVSQRTNEIGIRMALGAQASDVLKLVLRQGLMLALGGAAMGLLGALALTRLLSKLLFGISATDPLTFASVPLLLIAVALVACWLPARRAARVNPLIALRNE
ncbi:MAG: ADOP family duplicated permease [Blastocatellia bacterium]